MPRLRVENRSRPLRRPLQVRDCVTFACRLRGLMFRRALSPEEGLLLRGGRMSRLDSAIHMLFVYFDLGVLWLDAQGRVVDRRRARRWRPLYVPSCPARDVLEIHPDRLEEFQLGDRLHFAALD